MSIRDYVNIYFDKYLTLHIWS